VLWCCRLVAVTQRVGSPLLFVQRLAAASGLVQGSVNSMTAARHPSRRLAFPAWDVPNFVAGQQQPATRPSTQINFAGAPARVVGTTTASLKQFNPTYQSKADTSVPVVAA
jgi:hypothetical protein